MWNIHIQIKKHEENIELPTKFSNEPMGRLDQTDVSEN